MDMDEEVAASYTQFDTKDEIKGKMMGSMLSVKYVIAFISICFQVVSIGNNFRKLTIKE